MGTEPRVTTQTLKVLSALMAKSPDVLSGAEIATETKLQSGTLYPILFRLEQAGWLDSHWETETAQELGRPRRRFYELTAVGVRKTKSAIREMRSLIGGLAWQGR